MYESLEQAKAELELVHAVSWESVAKEEFDAIAKIMFEDQQEPIKAITKYFSEGVF